MVVRTQGGVDEDPQTVTLKNWDNITARLADSATLAFLLLQLPQIILNTQNLMAGNQSALFAIPWMVCFLVLSHHSRCCCRPQYCLKLFCQGMVAIFVFGFNQVFMFVMEKLRHSPGDLNKSFGRSFARESCHTLF